jgi:hypothetical protein
MAAFLNNPLSGLQAKVASAGGIEIPNQRDILNTVPESGWQISQQVDQWPLVPYESLHWPEAVITVLQQNRNDDPLSNVMWWQNFAAKCADFHESVPSNVLSLQLIAIQDPVCEILQPRRNDFDVVFEYIDVEAHDVAATRPTTRAASESAEMNWLARNSRSLSAFAGEWLLILGDRLLVHSRDFREIRAEIARRNLISPFVYYVPSPREANAISI